MMPSDLARAESPAIDVLSGDRTSPPTNAAGNKSHFCHDPVLTSGTALLKDDLASLGLNVKEEDSSSGAPAASTTEPATASAAHHILPGAPEDGRAVSTEGTSGASSRQVKADRDRLYRMLQDVEYSIWLNDLRRLEEHERLRSILNQALAASKGQEEKQLRALQTFLNEMRELDGQRPTDLREMELISPLIGTFIALFVSNDVLAFNPSDPQYATSLKYEGKAEVPAYESTTEGDRPSCDDRFRGSDTLHFYVRTLRYESVAQLKDEATALSETCPASRSYAQLLLKGCGALILRGHTGPVWRSYVGQTFGSPLKRARRALRRQGADPFVRWERAAQKGGFRANAAWAVHSFRHLQQVGDTADIRKHLHIQSIETNLILLFGPLATNVARGGLHTTFDVPAQNVSVRHRDMTLWRPLPSWQVAALERHVNKAMYLLNSVGLRQYDGAQHSILRGISNAMLYKGHIPSMAIGQAPSRELWLEGSSDQSEWHGCRPGPGPFLGNLSRAAALGHASTGALQIAASDTRRVILGGFWNFWQVPDPGSGASLARQYMCTAFLLARTIQEMRPLVCRMYSHEAFALGVSGMASRLAVYGQEILSPKSDTSHSYVADHIEAESDPLWGEDSLRQLLQEGNITARAGMMEVVNYGGVWTLAIAMIHPGRAHHDPRFERLVVSLIAAVDRLAAMAEGIMLERLEEANVTQLDSPDARKQFLQDIYAETQARASSCGLLHQQSALREALGLYQNAGYHLNTRVYPEGETESSIYSRLQPICSIRPDMPASLQVFRGKPHSIPRQAQWTEYTSREQTDDKGFGYEDFVTRIEGTPITSTLELRQSPFCGSSFPSLVRTSLKIRLQCFGSRFSSRSGDGSWYSAKTLFVVLARLLHPSVVRSLSRKDSFDIAIHCGHCSQTVFGDHNTTHGCDRLRDFARAHIGAEGFPKSGDLIGPDWATSSETCGLEKRYICFPHEAWFHSTLGHDQLGEAEKGNLLAHLQAEGIVLSDPELELRRGSSRALPSKPWPSLPPIPLYQSPDRNEELNRDFATAILYQVFPSAIDNARYHTHSDAEYRSTRKLLPVVHAASRFTRLALYTCPKTRCSVVLIRPVRKLRDSNDRIAASSQVQHPCQQDDPYHSDISLRSYDPAGTFTVPRPTSMEPPTGRAKNLRPSAQAERLGLTEATQFFHLPPEFRVRCLAAKMMQRISLSEADIPDWFFRGPWGEQPDYFNQLTESAKVGVKTGWKGRSTLTTLPRVGSGEQESSPNGAGSQETGMEGTIAEVTGAVKRPRTAVSILSTTSRESHEKATLVDQNSAGSQAAVGPSSSPQENRQGMPPRVLSMKEVEAQRLSRLDKSSTQDLPPDSSPGEGRHFSTFPWKQV